MHAMQHWGCLYSLYRQYDIAVHVLWGYVASSPWKCLNSVNAKVFKVNEYEVMHAMQHWGCLYSLYRQYDIAVLVLWGYVASSPWKCLNSVNATEEFWAEFCACCCHFIFSCWQDKWINTQNNKLRNINFTLLTDTNTERGFYIEKHLKHTFIIHTTSLNIVSPWQLHDSHYASLACLTSMNFILFMSTH